jgi:hypothetical protein
MPDLVGAALREWGAKYAFDQWEMTTHEIADGPACYIWRSRGAEGSLAIRFTELLTKRGLEPALIVELDKHQVGRLARRGNWQVNVLTNGREVSVRAREESTPDPISHEAGGLPA